jgi:hydroxymethylpyrimidine pyrophosphatase-like HAD family hydrolase/energy-coupling factor transporter ATP-binding protein EcfA2
MRYYVLACDYDDTLASQGRVDEEVVAALKRVKSSGRKLIMVTGRELSNIIHLFPHLDLFDRVVVENGALLYRPDTPEEKLLGEAPNPQLIELLHQRGVSPLGVGHVIVATREPYEKIALETIHELGLELQVIFNKGAVMILPSGLNKASGLSAALSELHLSPHNAVGIGDAENDHAFLSQCECAVAVANALPILMERADFVTQRSNGQGTIELMDKLVDSDLVELESSLTRHEFAVGTREDGQEIRIKPYGTNVLVAGTSGSGKSTFATSFLERLIEHDYQFCIIDPEGDYQNFEGAMVLGEVTQAPLVDEVCDFLKKSMQNAVINLLGVAIDHRPAFFKELLPALLKLRLQTGRPHWIVIDEAHHVLPSDWAPASAALPQELHGLMMITVHPDRVAPAILASVDTVIAIGDAPDQIIQSFSKTIGHKAPKVPANKLKPGEGIAWHRRQKMKPVQFRGIPPQTEHQRHVRKYAEGKLSDDNAFYFRGPQGKLKLRAQNLITFIELAEGVDDESWLHHLRQGDYSNWFRSVINDEELAKEAEKVEKMADMSAEKSRALIKTIIEARYTKPE